MIEVFAVVVSLCALYCQGPGMIEVFAVVVKISLFALYCQGPGMIEAGLGIRSSVFRTNHSFFA